MKFSRRLKSVGPQLWVGNAIALLLSSGWLTGNVARADLRMVTAKPETDQTSFVTPFQTNQSEPLIPGDTHSGKVTVQTGSCGLKLYLNRIGANVYLDANTIVDIEPDTVVDGAVLVRQGAVRVELTHRKTAYRAFVISDANGKSITVRGSAVFARVVPSAQTPNALETTFGCIEGTCIGPNQQLLDPGKEVTVQSGPGLYPSKPSDPDQLALAMPLINALADRKKAAAGAMQLAMANLPPRPEVAPRGLDESAGAIDRAIQAEGVGSPASVGLGLSRARQDPGRAVVKTFATDLDVQTESVRLQDVGNKGQQPPPRPIAVPNVPVNLIATSMAGETAAQVKVVAQSATAVAATTALTINKNIISKVIVSFDRRDPSRVAVLAAPAGGKPASLTRRERPRR